MQYYSFLITTVFMIVACCTFDTAYGYGTGAPTSACTTMVPGHVGKSPQPSNTNPYSVSASSATYTPGGTITVTISGNNFQGMLLQARQPGQTTPVGTFSNPPSNTRLLRCTSAGDSITHANTNTKNSGTSFTWTAPSQGVGTIEFVATVAQAKSTYWTAFPSSQLTESSSSGVTDAVTNSAATDDGVSAGSRISQSASYLLLIATTVFLRYC
ncbi:putative defense protein 3 isoform X2 [Glandiceps talaboti]